MIASQNGHVEVVDKLLHHGATVDLQSEVMSALCLYHTYQWKIIRVVSVKCHTCSMCKGPCD